jgi:chorismate mutase
MLDDSLERRIAELSEEIRHYPTPIARCDEQLSALLEQRAHLIGQLKRPSAHAGGCSPLGTWINDGGLNGA